MLLPVACLVHLAQQPFTKRCILAERVLGVREVERVFDLIFVVRWVCAHVRPDFCGRVGKNGKLALLHVEALALTDVVVRTDRDLQLTDCVLCVMNSINFAGEYVVISADEVAVIGSVNCQGGDVDVSGTDQESLTRRSNRAVCVEYLELEFLLAVADALEVFIAQWDCN